MDRDLIQDYLQRAEMNEAQAEVLSRIFAGMATKSDLLVLGERLTTQVAQLESRLTWRMIAVVGFFATAATLLNAYIG